MKKHKILSIIPVYNRADQTLKFLSALSGMKSELYDLDILVIDDGSTDQTYEKISANFNNVILEKGDGNLWWSGGVNMGLEYALENKYDYAYIVNDDNVIKKDTLDALYKETVLDDNYICSSLVLSVDNGVVLNAGLNYTGIFKKIRENRRGERVEDVKNIMNVDLFGSRSTLLPVKCIKEIGLFDEKRFPQHYSDLEYFNRAKEYGYKLLVIPSSIVLTRENTNYLHHYIQDCTFSELLKAYMHIRHPFHYKTIFYRCYVGRRFFRGSILLFRETTVHCSWIILKFFAPNVLIKRIIASIK